MELLKIALIQSDISWENKDANLIRFQSHIETLPKKVDLVVLPEMFTTGFTMNAEKMAEDMKGPTMEWMSQMASTHQTVVVGSFIAIAGGHYYNRLVWMRPDATYSFYDKKHLFTYADEHRYFSAGKERLVVNVKGWRFLPLICYDLRFPVWSRNSLQYDVLLYVANFPEKRSHAWKSLLVARAIENQAYVIGLNRVGVDGNGISYSGDSTLIDFAGEMVAQSTLIEKNILVTLSQKDLKSFREKFQFLKDQDPFHFVS